MELRSPAGKPIAVDTHGHRYVVQTPRMATRVSL